MKLFVDMVFFAATFVQLFWARKEFDLRVNTASRFSFVGERTQSDFSSASTSSQYTATQVKIYYHTQSHFPLLTVFSVFCISRKLVELLITILCPIKV
jgi:hypothetical protein